MEVASLWVTLLIIATYNHKYVFPLLSSWGKFIIHKPGCAHHKTIQFNFFLQAAYTPSYIMGREFMKCISKISGATRALTHLLPSTPQHFYIPVDVFWVMPYLQHRTSVWCSPGHQANKLCHNVFPVPKTVKERDWLPKHKDTSMRTTAILNGLGCLAD